MERFNVRSSKRLDTIVEVLQTIEEMMSSSGHSLADFSLFPSTRDIADRCSLSIYSTRHILLLLQEKGLIDSVKGKHAKHLYWKRTDSPGLKH
ncbi:FaeA-like protein [Izhakiella capsodis]|uniref:FaeA-like protein n=1 Tax=Izhakiella capsodis TaxID=1367852 RepID=A0A1I5ASX5_9GAMM|nr:FaeA/PapI family transcriptional regulator [Izhakiella capsodis]SFN65543.1 FaeA-like protein [Izhakiella capsodis]